MTSNKLLKKLIKEALFNFDGEEWFELEFYWIKKHPDYNKKRWDKAMWDGSDVKYTNKLTEWASKRMQAETNKLLKHLN